MKKTTFERYKIALLEANGNVSIAAKKLDMERTTLSTAISKNPALKEVLEETRMKIDDTVENTFLKTMLGDAKRNIEPNLTAMIFYMKTRMRYRGYVEKIVVEHSVKGVLDAINRLSPEEYETLVTELEEAPARVSSLN